MEEGLGGLEFYHQVIENYDRMISEGQKPRRMQEMNYHSAKRELYLHMAKEAKMIGDDSAYELFNSRAEECNHVLMQLESRGSGVKPRRKMSGLEDFDSIRQQIDSKARLHRVVICISG